MHLKLIYIHIFIYTYLYLFLRDNVSMLAVGWGAVERGERIPSSLHAESGNNLGLNPTTLRPLSEPKPEDGHLTNCTTQAPQIYIFAGTDNSFLIAK